MVTVIDLLLFNKPELETGVVILKINYQIFEKPDMYIVQKFINLITEKITHAKKSKKY